MQFHCRQDLSFQIPYNKIVHFAARDDVFPGARDIHSNDILSMTLQD